MNVYEFELFETDEDKGWILVEPFDFPGMTEGKGLSEAAYMACDFMRMWAEAWYIDGKEPPVPTYGNTPRHPGGRILLVPMNDPKLTIRKTTPSDAARQLGISPARVTQLVKEAKLEAFTDEFGKRWITQGSIECRLNDHLHLKHAAKRKTAPLAKAAAL